MLTANVSWQGVLTLGTTSKVRDESSIRSQAALVCSFEHLRLRRSLTSARTRGLKGLFSRRRHALTVTVCVSKAPLLFFRVGLEGEFNSDSKVRNPKNLGPSMAPAPHITEPDLGLSSTVLGRSFALFNVAGSYSFSLCVWCVSFLFVGMLQGVLQVSRCILERELCFSRDTPGFAAEFTYSKLELEVLTACTGSEQFR